MQKLTADEIERIVLKIFTSRIGTQEFNEIVEGVLLLLNLQRLEIQAVVKKSSLCKTHFAYFKDGLNVERKNYAITMFCPNNQSIREILQKNKDVRFDVTMNHSKQNNVFDQFDGYYERCKEIKLFIGSDFQVSSVLSLLGYRMENVKLFYNTNDENSSIKFFNNFLVELDNKLRRRNCFHKNQSRTKRKIGGERAGNRF